MLSKKFKPAKCKTSLKLVVSRIKLLRNKRETQVKLMRRELAQLLDGGQDQTARIRVEHVIREEKTMAAYDLIEIYCELLIARLTVIESQKNCPIDLKEAVSSVVFASPRCEDIPELVDIRKQFAAKYGKEFINSALELRPECGVSRLVADKLSAKAPDIETKVKTLTAIAQEHNVKWESKSFDEELRKPHDDLLNGPTSFVSASNMSVQSSITSPAPSQFYQSSFKLPQNESARRPTSYSSFFESSASIPAAQTNESNTRMTQNDSTGRSTGLSSSGGEVNKSYPREDGVSFNSPIWNMDFPDATSAAQAAAESAERASIAARAAAKLASRESLSRQSSTGSYVSPRYSDNNIYEKPANFGDQNMHRMQRNSSTEFSANRRANSRSSSLSSQGSVNEILNVRMSKDDVKNDEDATSRINSLKKSSSGDSSVVGFDSYKSDAEEYNSAASHKNRRNILDSCPREEPSSSNRSYGKSNRSKSIDSMRPTFDNSDSDTTDGEEENNNFLHNQRQSANSLFSNEKSTSESNHIYMGDVKDFNVKIPNYSSTDEEEIQPSRLIKRQSTMENDQGINFRKLNGGFKHKGLPTPPFIKNSGFTDEKPNSEVADKNKNSLESQPEAYSSKSETSVIELQLASNNSKVDDILSRYGRKKAQINADIESRSRMAYIDSDVNEENVDSPKERNVTLPRRTRDLLSDSNKISSSSKIKENTRSTQSNLNDDINTQSSTSSGESMSRENSLNKASHTHPKLPDYDTLANHFHLLRSNLH